MSFLLGLQNQAPIPFCRETSNSVRRLLVLPNCRIRVMTFLHLWKHLAWQFSIIACKIYDRKSQLMIFLPSILQISLHYERQKVRKGFQVIPPWFLCVLQPNWICHMCASSTIGFYLLVVACNQKQWMATVLRAPRDALTNILQGSIPHLTIGHLFISQCLLSEDLSNNAS